MPESIPFPKLPMIYRIIPSILVACVLCCLLFGGMSVAVADNRVLGHVQKSTQGGISSDGSVAVIVRLAGENLIVELPADIVLVLDRSSSMKDEIPSEGKAKMDALVEAVDHFVAILDVGTDGAADGDFGDSRVGVVSFTDKARIDSPLIFTTTGILSATHALRPLGWTAIRTGIIQASSLLVDSESQRVMIVLTDGYDAPENSLPGPAIESAKKAAIRIFTIGFGPTSPSRKKLREWASEPYTDTAFVAPTEEDLDAIFRNIGMFIVRPAASRITFNDTVDSDYAVQNAETDVGTVITHANVITWRLDQLLTGTAALTYMAVPIDQRASYFTDLRTSVIYSEGTCSDISSMWLVDRIYTVVSFRSVHECRADRHTADVPVEPIGRAVRRN